MINHLVLDGIVLKTTYLTYVELYGIIWNTNNQSIIIYIEIMIGGGVKWIM